MNYSGKHTVKFSCTVISCKVSVKTRTPPTIRGGAEDVSTVTHGPKNRVTELSGSENTFSPTLEGRSSVEG